MAESGALGAMARRAGRLGGAASLGFLVVACGGGFGEPSQAPPAMATETASEPASAFALAPRQRAPEPALNPAAQNDLQSTDTKNTKSNPPGEAPMAAPEKELSALLPSGFYNPMPGGVFAGYRADTGLDIAGSPRPVYAIAAGTLDYSEPGHTLWTGPTDTANCVRFKLDSPIPWKGRQITHVYYAHLSQLEYHQAEGATERIRVQGGERLGMSGKARGSPHLHIGLLLDGEVEQYAGTFLFEDEIRELLGGYKNGKSLPKAAEKAPETAR